MKTDLNIKRGVETHPQISVGIRRQGPQERLLEDSHGETISENHETVGSVAQRFHL